MRHTPEFYRFHAEETRTKADEMVTLECREQMFVVAGHYETMAVEAEKIERSEKLINGSKS